jgi:hypothetical protein
VFANFQTPCFYHDLVPQAAPPQEAAPQQQEDPAVDPQQLQLEKQLLKRATADKGFALRYLVPWDIWQVVWQLPHL